MEKILVRELKRLVANDGTVKVLLMTNDGESIETVGIPSSNGLTGCINFYKSTFINSSIKVENGECEDSLNIVNSKGMIDLGVSSDQLIVGKYGAILKVIKNLKSFKKTDLDQKYYEESFGRGPAPTPKGYDAAMKKMLKYMQKKAT